jgi:perosamine synthetase
MLIRWASPSFDESDERELLDSLRTGRVTMGPKVRAFEERMAAYLGVRHAVAVSSGTAALDIALGALGVGPGDEVVVPTFTYVATVHAVVHQGATPVLVDIDPVTLNVDPEAVRAAVTERTRCIIAIDYGGGVADWDALERVARERGCPLVQDAAHTVGGSYHGRLPGAFGIGATLSFHAAKVLTTVEGGMLVTNDAQLAETARMMRCQGEAPGRKYVFPVVGHNFRMSDLHAGIGLAQLAKLPRLLARRREIAGWYAKALGGIEGLRLPRERPGTLHPYFLYSIVFGDPAARDRAIAALDATGIETRVCWPMPVHRQEAYAARTTPDSRPHAEWAAARVLSLPIHADLSRSDVDLVARTILGALPRASS